MCLFAAARSRGGNQLVHWVAANGRGVGKDNLALLKWLVLEKGADAKARDKYGGMPLMYAAKESNLPIVQFLIDEMGIPVDIPTTSGKDTALQIASEKGHLEVVEWLVGKAGANIFLRNVQGQSPRDLAAVNGHHDIVKYLDTRHAEMKV